MAPACRPWYRQAMARRARELSDRPHSLDDGAIARKSGRAGGSVDVLADLLDSLRASTLVYGRFELGAPWGFELPDTEATHLIAVARGAARLEVGGARRPLSLSAGDLALLPHRGAHTLRDAKG